MVSEESFKLGQMGSIPSRSTGVIMLNTVDAMRLFCDGQTSIFEVRSILMSIGHSKQDCADAFAILHAEPGTKLRFGKYQKDEWQAEIYLTVQQ